MGLLDLRAERHVFEEAGEHSLAALDGAGEQHAVRLQPAQLAWCEIGDDDHLAADERFGLVGFGDAGEDLARLRAEVDFEAQQLVCLGHALGNLYLGDAQLDLGEVIDGDLAGGGGELQPPECPGVAHR